MEECARLAALRGNAPLPPGPRETLSVAHSIFFNCNRQSDSPKYTDLQSCQDATDLLNPECRRMACSVRRACRACHAHNLLLYAFAPSVEF